MPNLEKFIKFLIASPSSGLVIKDKTINIETIEKKLSEMKKSFISLAINLTSNEENFWQKIEEAMKKNLWLILDIEEDIPAWLYKQLQVLSGNGHLYNHQANKEISLETTSTRILVLIAEKDLEKSSFNNLLDCFGIVFRNER